MLKRHAVTLRGQEAKDEGAYTCPDMYQAVAIAVAAAAAAGGPAWGTLGQARRGRT